MFEYLMPLVVMPTYENTLLDQTYKAAVSRQIAYGAQRGVPWGVSESGYNAVDAHLNYQYRAFGVPGTGLKRGLADDLVVAPYASALALMVAPEEACVNLQRLSDEGFEGTLRLIRSRRLYAFARAPRTALRRDPFVHGASPGHEPAFVRPPAAGPPDAAAVRGPTRCSRPPRCCCRSVCRGRWRSIRACAEVSDLRAPAERSGDAGARHPQPEYAVAGTAAPVERPVPRDGHQRRRRLQPLERSGGDALARRRHLRQLGHLLLSARRCPRGEFWSSAFQPTLRAVGQL